MYCSYYVITIGITWKIYDVLLLYHITKDINFFSLNLGLLYKKETGI